MKKSHLAIKYKLNIFLLEFDFKVHVFTYYKIKGIIVDHVTLSEKNIIVSDEGATHLT